jgi:hypothetical protein
MTDGAEYYTVGHDEIQSALSSYILKSRRNRGDNGGRIKLADLPNDELSSLAFLFGGVGDGNRIYLHYAT